MTFTLPLWAIFSLSLFSSFHHETPPRAKSSNWINFLIFLLQYFCPDTSVWFISCYNTWRLVCMCSVFLWEQKLLNILVFWLKPVTRETETSILDNHKRNTKWKTIFSKIISMLPSPSWDSIHFFCVFFFGVCCSLFFSFNHAIAIYVCWSEIKNITLLRELTDRRVLVSNDGLIKKRLNLCRCAC